MSASLEQPQPVRWPIYVVVVLAVGLLVFRFVLFGRIVPRDEGQAPTITADNEGTTWSFQQLISHFRKSDFSLAVATTTEKTDDGPIVTVCRADDQRGRAAKTVDVQRHASSASARDYAHRRPVNSFAWGRFSFTGDRDLLDDIARGLR